MAPKRPTNIVGVPNGGRIQRGGRPAGRSRPGEPDASLWSGLSDRDRRVLALLNVHKVLTTNQLAALEFPNVDRAQHRLMILARRGLLWRWRPTLAWGGSAPHHYALGFAGGKLIAAQKLADPPRPGAWETRLTRLVESPQLRHLLGVNDFFCDLAQYARTHETECVGPETGYGGLTWWMSETQCREWIYPYEEMARPDGIGCFEAGGRMVRFFLEYDTGTETQKRLIEKINRYEKMLTDAFGVVLFWLHSAAREKAFHQALHRHYGKGETPFVIATASRDHHDPDGPAGAVWAVYGPARDHVQANTAKWRVRLAELPERGRRDHWPSLIDMPFTEAALGKPSSQELRFGLTADELTAQGRDPKTGKLIERRRPAPTSESRHDHHGNTDDEFIDIDTGQPIEDRQDRPQRRHW